MKQQIMVQCPNCDAIHTINIEIDQKMRVASYEMTCGACPSQWDIHLEDGTYLYCRYRHGWFSLSKGVGGEELLGVAIGNSMDGVMSTEEMKETTSTILDWSKC